MESIAQFAPLAFAVYASMEHFIKKETALSAARMGFIWTLHEAYVRDAQITVSSAPAEPRAHNALLQLTLPFHQADHALLNATLRPWPARTVSVMHHVKGVLEPLRLHAFHVRLHPICSKTTNV